MNATPQITADFEEYPELRTLAEQALRRIVELMEIHDIGELRRVHKTGVFDHPYHKDIVNPIGVPNVPHTVAAARYTVGAALLDYLEAVGIRGVTLSMTKEDVLAVNDLWNPRKAPEAKVPPDLDPTPAPEQPEQPETPATPAPDAETAPQAVPGDAPKDPEAPKESAPVPMKEPVKTETKKED